VNIHRSVRNGCHCDLQDSGPRTLQCRTRPETAKSAKTARRFSQIHSARDRAGAGAGARAEAGAGAGAGAGARAWAGAGAGAGAKARAKAKAGANARPKQPDGSSTNVRSEWNFSMINEAENSRDAPIDTRKWHATVVCAIGRRLSRVLSVARPFFSYFRKRSKYRDFSGRNGFE
jgi:hypothetical protein